MEEIYFHEDDYRQIEILPIENLEYCRKQMGKIDEFSETKKMGMGYSDVFLREENPILFESKKISVTQLEMVLIKIMNKCAKVVYGYGSYRKECENTFAFYYNKNISVFYEVDESIVKNIWLSLDIYNQNEITKAIEMLISLSSLGDFIIVDWSWSFSENLREEALILNYLTERLECFS